MSGGYRVKRSFFGAAWWTLRRLIRRLTERLKVCKTRRKKINRPHRGGVAEADGVILATTTSVLGPSPCSASTAVTTAQRLETESRARHYKRKTATILWNDGLQRSIRKNYTRPRRTQTHANRERGRGTSGSLTSGTVSSGR